jgi:SAM-dependent methyltransferase
MKLTHTDMDRHGFVEARLREMIRGKPARIFNVGAGWNTVAATIADLSPDATYRAFDKFPKADDITELDIIRDRLPEGDADIFLLMDCIEHLWSPEAAMRNIAAAMREGGTLLMTCPNPHWSKGRLHFLISGSLPCFTKRDLDSNHHVFTTWHHILFALAERNGFSVTEHVTLESKLELPNRMMSLSYPARLAGYLAGRWIEKRDPTSIGMSYALVARRTAEPVDVP